MCIKGNTTYTVTFPSNVLSIKWIKPDRTETLVVLSGAWTIPGEDVATIKLYSDTVGIIEIGYLSIQDKSGVTLFDNSGNGNHATLSDELARGYTVLARDWRNESNKEGLNKAAWFNEAEILYDLQLNGRDSLDITIYGAFHTSNTYMLCDTAGTFYFRWWSGYLTLAVYDIGFKAVDFLWATDYLIHKWRLRIELGVLSIYKDEQLLKSQDKGFNSFTNNSFLKVGKVSTNTTITALGLVVNDTELSDPLNGSTTGTPTNIDFNKILIPNDKSNEGFDIFGRASLHTSIAKYNAEVMGAMVGMFDGSSDMRNINRVLATGDVLINYAKVSSSSGAGYIFGGDLDGLSGLYQASGYIAIYNNSQGGFSNKVLHDYRDDLLHKFEIRITGATTCDLYIDDVFKTTFNKSITSITSIMSRAGIGFLIGSVYLVSISNTHLYHFNNAINSIDGITAINNGVTFEKDYSLVSKGVENGYVELSTGEQIINTEKNTPSFELPVGATLVKGGGFNSLEGTSLNMDKQVWDGTSLNMDKQVWDTYTDSDGNVHIDSPNRDGTNEYNNILGHSPHIMFNGLCFETNPFSYPEIILAANIPHILLDRPYHITPTILALVYFKVVDGVITQILPYTRQRTDFENSVLANKGYLPNYAGLPSAVIHDEVGVAHDGVQVIHTP